jgi:hypothetical protein
MALDLPVTFASQKPLKILIADDEASIHRTLEMRLKPPPMETAPDLQHGCRF